MLSSVLQLMFNAVDIIVVGRFSGSQALAAVGSTTALINIFVNLFIGISLGANVLAARFYALELKKEMSETVHTAITFALVSGIVVAVFGVTLARFALEIMATPEDVINKSVLYMRIYFCGMPIFYAVQLWGCRAESSGRYEKTAVVSDDIGCSQCGSESVSCDCISPGRSGCGNCDGDLPVHFLHSGFAVPVSHGK